MPIQYTAPGFEPTTHRFNVFSLQLYSIIFFEKTYNKFLTLSLLFSLSLLHE